MCFAFSDIKNNVNMIYKSLKNIEMFKNTIKTCDEIMKPLNVNVIEALENDEANDKNLAVGLRSVIIQVKFSFLSNFQSID